MIEKSHTPGLKTTILTFTHRTCGTYYSKTYYRACSSVHIYYLLRVHWTHCKKNQREILNFSDPNMSCNLYTHRKHYLLTLLPKKSILRKWTFRVHQNKIGDGSSGENLYHDHFCTYFRMTVWTFVLHLLFVAFSNTCTVADWSDCLIGQIWLFKF